ncbi:tetratricopeptide repeat protein [Brucepastera parasyntrophica]|uniref:tetratricopeptide repeat protein n=1 Tax=Brucepastera parasyntrophica TaxID=2880008 RepID=UPI00210DDDA8|nr:tetratricopeptide repeat protein [Brucepastera parasyntrophica]ULQ60943.1 tetratricopeptide repeat protein [Brucepastera parasyntrophica]
MNASFTVIIVILIAAAAILLLTFLGRSRAGKSPKQKKQKDRAVIIREANRRLAQNPRDPEGLTVMGNIYFQDQNWEKAYTAYEILFCLASSTPKIDPFENALRYGIAAIKLNKIPEATKAFVEARKLRRDSFEANYNLGYICYIQKEYEKAITFLKQALVIDPESIPAQKYMGFSMHKAHHFREALKYLKRALEAEPEDREILFAMAECLYETGAQEQALKIFSALSSHPTLGPHAALYSGIIYTQNGQFEKAITEFETGLKHDNLPKELSNDINYKLAAVLIKNQDLGRALSVLKEIQKTTPGYKDVPSLIVRYRELNQNKNLKTYLLSVQSEFTELCKKMVTEFFPGARVKITDIEMYADYSDIVAKVDTSKWTDIVLFRFYRGQGSIGEIPLRDFHARIKDIKAGKGICVAAGVFTDEAKRFIDGRPVYIYDKDQLNKLLNKIE